MKKRKLFKLGKRKLIVAITALSILAISLGVFLSLPFIKGATVGPPKPTPTPDWGSTTIEANDHNFSVKDSILRDTVKTATSQPNVVVEFKSKQAISYWDFFNPDDYLASGAGQAGFNDIMTLAKHTYSIYPLPGLDTFFLITDETTNKTVGVFKKTTINRCFVSDAGDYEDGYHDAVIVACPFKYYKAYSWWGGHGGRAVYIYTKTCSNWTDKNCEKRKPDYELKASDPDQKTFLYKYIQGANATKFEISGVGGHALTCAKPGSDLTTEEYEKCFFPEGGTFPVSIQDNKDKPPTMRIGGATFDQTKHPGAERPAITFTLNYVLLSGNIISSGSGGGLSGAVYFYFVATDPSYPNLAIRINNCDTENLFVTISDKEKLNDDGEIKGPVVKIDQKSLTSLVNKVYNEGPYKDGECPADKINVEDTGQLAKWGVERTERNEISDSETSACEKQICTGFGITSSFNIFSAGFWKRMMCSMSCAITDSLTSFMKTMIKWLEGAAGISKGFFVEKAYAASLADQLKPGGKVAAGWRYSLGIVDIVVVFALIAIGFANMLKINIDVYSIKRALPGLLMGVLLANFSLLICRLVVDFAGLLSQYFLDLGGGMSIMSMGVLEIFTVATVAGIFGLVTGGLAIGACVFLIAGLIFLGIPFLLILVLTFLFYARGYVIWFLVMLAPLAFITLGLPPAASYFSKWWSWFMKWVFMAPIAFFFLGLAAYIDKVAGIPLDKVLAAGAASGAGTLGWFGGWFLYVVVLFLAVYIPWTIGGAIMKAWGGLGAMLGKYGLRTANFYTAGLTDWASKTKLGSRLGIKKWSPMTAGMGFAAMRRQREREQYSGMMGAAYDESMKKVGRGFFPFMRKTDDAGNTRWGLRYGAGPTTFKGKMERELAQMKEAEEYKYLLEIGDRESAAKKAIQSGDQWTAEVLMYAMPMTGDVRKNVFNAYAKKFGGQLSKEWIEAMEEENDAARGTKMAALTTGARDSYDPNDIRVGEVAMTLGRLATFNGRPLEKYAQETIDVEQNGRIKFRIRSNAEQQELIASQVMQMAGRDRQRIAQEFWEEMRLPTEMDATVLAELNTKYAAQCARTGENYVQLKGGDLKPLNFAPEDLSLRLKPYVATREQQAMYRFMDKEVLRTVKLGEHAKREDIAVAIELEKRNGFKGLKGLGIWEDLITKYRDKGYEADSDASMDALEKITGPGTHPIKRDEWFSRR